MENSSTSGTNNTTDIQESNNSVPSDPTTSSNSDPTSSILSSVSYHPSSNPTTIQDQPSTSSKHCQSVDKRKYTDLSQDSLCSSTPTENTTVCKKHKIDSPQENEIPQKKMKLNREDNGDQSTSRSESSEPGPSGLSTSNRQHSKVEELSRAILANMTDTSNIPKTTSVPQDHGDESTDPENQNLSVQTEDDTQNETINQYSNTYTSELTDNITQDMILPVLGTNETNIDTEINEESSAHHNLTNNKTTNLHPNIQTEVSLVNIPTNVANRVECDDTTEDQMQSTSENNGESNTQTELPTFVDCSVCGVPREDSENLAEPNEDQIYNQMMRGLASTPEEISRSRSEISDPVISESYAVAEELNENSEINVDDSSLVDDPVPGTSGVSEERLQNSDEQTLENMMMNMRRNAEANLRARFMPLIRSNIPENDREEIVRYSFIIYLFTLYH